MTDKKSLNTAWLFLIGTCMCLVLVFLDQITKHAASVFLKGQKPVVLIPSVLKLQYLYPENRGIAFGLMQGSTVFFSVFTIILLLFLLFLFFRVPKTRRMIPAFLAGILLVSGAVGNLLDSVLPGYVIDFIYFYLIDFPVFNLADVFVVTGTFLMAFLLLFVYKDGELAPGKGKPE